MGMRRSGGGVEEVGGGAAVDVETEGGVVVGGIFGMGAEDVVVEASGGKGGEAAIDDFGPEHGGSFEVAELGFFEIESVDDARTGGKGGDGARGRRLLRTL